MVVGYSELEISFAHAAGLVLGLKYKILNASLGIYSENGKIKLVNALARDAFERAGLLDPYRTARNMLSNCATIRNTYAHCQYRHTRKRHRLEYVTSEDIVNANWPNTADELPWKPLPLKFLREQEAYFEGTRKWLHYLENTLEQRGKRRPIVWKIPPTLQLPQRSNSNPKPKPSRKQPRQS